MCDWSIRARKQTFDIPDALVFSRIYSGVCVTLGLLSVHLVHQFYSFLIQKFSTLCENLLCTVMHKLLCNVLQFSTFSIVNQKVLNMWCRLNSVIRFKCLVSENQSNFWIR